MKKDFFDAFVSELEATQISANEAGMVKGGTAEPIVVANLSVRKCGIVANTDACNPNNSPLLKAICKMN